MPNENLLKAPTSSSYEYERIDRGGNHTWQPSFLGRAPWLGLATMFGALIGVVAAVSVLYTSDNEPIHAWTIQPTVYLAITSAATNIFLHFALSQAVTVAWWTRALRNKTTVADLHRRWEDGQSLWAALTSGRHCSVISLATIFVALVPINGPLLQRASRVRQGHFDQDTHLSIHIAPELPEGYTGYLGNRADQPTLLTPPFIQVLQEFNKALPIAIVDSGCRGSCSTKVSGAGLVANCSESSSPFFLSESEGNDEEFQKALNGTEIFGTYFFWPPQADMPRWPVMTPGTFNLGVQFKSTEDCKGTMVVRNCTFRPATVTYPVSIDGNTSSISLAAGTTVFDDEIQNIIPVPPFSEPFSHFNISTYGGFFKSLNDAYASVLYMNYATTGYQVYNQGALSNRYLKASNDLRSINCTLAFRDPTEDIIAAARELMFRAAIASANSTQPANVQRVAAKESFDTPVYKLVPLFLALAIVISLLGWIATIPVFLGWWHLGRAVSLSPIETAKAFGAPGLGDKNSNADVNSILKVVQEREIQYGALVTVTPDENGDKGTTKMRLTMGEPEHIRPPKAGQSYNG